MKKLGILIIVLCLFGCSNSSKLEKLGYSQSDIDKIQTFSEETQELFLNEYNEILASLIHIDGFKENKALSYVKYYGLYDDQKLVELVNDGTLNDTSYSKLNELYSSEFYVAKYEDLYLKYLNEYDSIRDLLEIVNTHRYCDLYTDIVTTDLSKGYMILVNKYNKLPSDYEPDDLVDIDSKYGRGVTRAAVYEAYKQMSDDALEAGCDFWICSAYRSYDTQEVLYNRYLDEEGGDQSIVDTYSARPGHSEHQSGLCLDLYDTTYGMEGFGNSESSKWINENCYKYGFIVRYTKEKENITGYDAEPWQVRYVGSAEIAKDIMDKNITFDEYYACFVE